MSTATIERIETAKTKPKKSPTFHRLTVENLILKVRGLPHEALCGKKFKPNKSFKNARHTLTLGPMEKCVVCEMLYASQK